MGKGGGFITQLVGFVLTIVGMIMNVYAPGSGTGLMAVGMTMMFGGSIWAASDARRAAREAMERLRDQAKGMKATTRTTQKAIPLPYGRVRVGGNIVYMKAAGASNNDLHIIYGVGEGPIDGWEEVWFDDTKVWDVSSAVTQIDSADSGKLQTPYKDSFSLAFRPGVNSQDVFWQVNSAGDADFADRYPLLACAYVKLVYNQNVYQHVPQINFTIRGLQTTDMTTPTMPSQWTQNPVNALYDQMTNQRYGWGLPSSKINNSYANSAAVYSAASLSVFSDYVSETIDSRIGPKEWTGTFRHRTTATFGSGVVAFNVSCLQPFSQTSGGVQFLAVRHPIRPGSLSLKFFHPFDGLAHTITDSYQTTNPTTGLLTDAGSLWGYVNYVSGVCSVDAYGLTQGGMSDVGETWDTYEKTLTANWFISYALDYRTKYQYLARSIYTWCGSEQHTEVSCGVLSSNSGGAGAVDYTNGKVSLTFGGAHYFQDEPIRVYYKLSGGAIQRFTYNTLVFDSQKAIDLFRSTGTHFRGFIVYTDGQYMFRSDAPGSSIYSFNDDNIIAGSFKIAQAPVSERPNRIRVKFIDALQNYTAADFLYETASPAVVVADMREANLELLGCVYRDLAHRMGRTLANQVALGNNVEFSTNLDAQAVRPGDIIDVTHPSASWSAKLFRVYETNETQEGDLNLKAIEHADNVYVDEWQFGVPTAHVPTFFPVRAYFPPAVTSLSLREIPQTLSDGTITPMLEVTAEANASSATVGGYKFWLDPIDVTSKAGSLLYAGPSNKYISHVKPGWHGVTAFTYSEFDQNVLSAKGITGYIGISGEPELEWQKYRIIGLDENRSVVSSDNIYYALEMPTTTDAIRVGSMDVVLTLGNGPLGQIHARMVDPNPMVPTYVNCIGLGSTAIQWTLSRVHPNSNGTLFINHNNGGYIQFTGSMTVVTSTTGNGYIANSQSGDGKKYCRTVATSAYYYHFGFVKNNSVYNFRCTVISKGNFNANTVWIDVATRTSDSIYSDMQEPYGTFAWFDCVVTNSYMQAFVYHAQSVTAGYDAHMVNYTYSMDMAAQVSVNTLFSSVVPYRVNFCNLAGEVDAKAYYWTQVDPANVFTGKGSYIGLLASTPTLNKIYTMTARDFDVMDVTGWASRICVSSGDSGKIVQYMTKRISSMTNCTRLEADTYQAYKPSSYVAARMQSWI